MFGLNAQDIGAINAGALRSDMPTPPEVEAGFFDNALGASGSGLATSFLQSSNVLYSGIGYAARGVDYVSGTDSEFYVNEIQRGIDIAINKLEPSPETTGTLGQLGYGVTTVLPQAAAGFALAGPVGAFTSVSLSQGVAEKRELVEAGVDEATAIGGGLIAGATAGVGVVLPASIGSNVLTRIASGAAMNVGLGVAQRASTSALLRSNGYADMAEQYKAFDGMSIAIDAILGGAFGGLSRSKVKIKQRGQSEGDAIEAEPQVQPAGKQNEGDVVDVEPQMQTTQSDIDTALTMNSVYQLEVDSALGIPANIETRNAHVNAMKIAQEQLLRGDAINVSAAFTKGERLQFVIKDDSFIESAYIREIQALRERGDDSNAAALEQELFIARKRDADRDVKLRQVEEKYEQSRADIEQALSEINTIVERLDFKPSALDDLRELDPITADRISDIQQELTKPALTKKKRESLQQELLMLQGTRRGLDYKGLKVKRDTEREQLLKSKEAIEKQLAQLEKKAERYRLEADKRRGKIEKTRQAQELKNEQEQDLLDITNSGVFSHLVMPDNQPKATDTLINPELSGADKMIDVGVDYDAPPDILRIGQLLNDLPEDVLTIEVPILDDDGNYIGVGTLGDVLRDADIEIAKSEETGMLLNVAAACFIRNGT